MLLPPVTPDRARRIARRTGGASVLVIGDAMLDKFIVGRVTRISPEAPVPVVAFDHEMFRMGGAANVAHNIAALGGQATLVAVTGMDEAAATLAHACREAGIAPSLVGDASRPTTTKVRIVTERNQQVARIDYEADAEIADDIEQRIIAEIEKHAPRASAIVISDYLKGCITRKVVAGGRRQRRRPACRCSSIRRSRTSTTTPARRSSRPIITKRRSRRTCASAARTRRALAARQFRDARAVRERADDARRSGDVAAQQTTARDICPPPRARWPTSPAPATP